MPVDSAVGGASCLAFERSGEAGVGEGRPAGGIVVGGEEARCAVVVARLAGLDEEGAEINPAFIRFVKLLFEV